MKNAGGINQQLLASLNDLKAEGKDGGPLCLNRNLPIEEMKEQFLAILSGGATNIDELKAAQIVATRNPHLLPI